MTRERFALLQPDGRLYFTVPAGVKKFTLGFDANPRQNIIVYNAAGEKVMQKEIEKLDILELSRQNAQKDEIWSIGIRKASWSVNVRLYSPLSGLVSPDPSLLLKKK